MALTKESARLMSLRKWERILKDWPNVKLTPGFQPDVVYGQCGFCELYRYRFCDECPLYPQTCSNFRGTTPEPLYWRICEALENNPKAESTRDLIAQMIAAIQEVK